MKKELVRVEKTMEFLYTEEEKKKLYRVGKTNFICYKEEYRRVQNEIVDNGDGTSTIYTSKGVGILVDTSSVKLLKNYCFGVEDNGYARTYVMDKKYYLHRILLRLDDYNGHIHVDHKNGNKLDNRLCNIREVTPQQNTWNMRKRCGETIHGIDKRESGNYRARIIVDGKFKHLGTYKDRGEAIRARMKAEKKYFGEYSPNIDLINKLGV